MIEFDFMRGLVLSYFVENDGDEGCVPQLFEAIRETCPTEFDRLLVLSAAAKDPRYALYCDDVLPLLRNVPITDDFARDVENLLLAMEQRHFDRAIHACRQS